MRRRFSNVHFDPETFGPSLKRCDLGKCQGTCCHDGAILSREEAEVITKLTDGESPTFAGLLGAAVPSCIDIERGDRGETVYRTARRPHEFSNRVEGFPKHFPDTACVFLMADHRCALQVFSESKGHHPWYWKPFACWLHPITIAEDRPRRLTIHHEENDPLERHDYPGFTAFTPCGMPCPGAPSAAVTLREELEFLGRILGRSFV